MKQRSDKPHTIEQQYFVGRKCANMKWDGKVNNLFIILTAGLLLNISFQFIIFNYPGFCIFFFSSSFFRK